MVPAIPRGLIAWIVDDYHVGTPPDIIAADIRRRAARAPQPPDERTTARMVRYALLRHRANGGLYRRVMGSWS